MSDLFRLDGETAVVTGGTGGLGGAMALALASFGARVILLGRNLERGEQRVEAIRAQGGEAEFFAVDVADPHGLSSVRDQIMAKHAGVQILVNAAGGNRPGATLPPGSDFCRLPLEAWREVVELNLVAGALLPIQIFGESMVQQSKGSIINIASMSGMIPLSRVVAYSAAKAAVLNLTQFLAREWAPYRIRVNAISPGFFPAEQNRALLYDEQGNLSERGAKIIGHTPMGRFGDPKELAGVVVWLASEAASSFVTGQNIVVDGGFSSCTI